MQSLELRISEALWTRIRTYHLAEGKQHESLSYLFCRAERTGDKLIILAPDSSCYFALAPDCFARQSAGNVRLRSDVQNAIMVQFAASDDNCLINIHDHWFCDDAVFSSVDDEDDRQFEHYLRSRFEPMLQEHPHIGHSRHIHNVSLVLGRQRHDLRLNDTGVGKTTSTHASIWSIGETLTELPLTRHTRPRPADANSRQRFLDDGAGCLGNLNIGIAGCGGLGSIAAESLGRIGVRELTLVDADLLEESNLNRWQGGRPQDCGQSKAHVLSARLSQLFPGIVCHVLQAELADDASTEALSRCNALIGGLDNDVARYQMTHLALQWMIPYFDAGVGIVTKPDTDFRSRYFAVVPGVTGCVICKGFELVNHQELTQGLADRAQYDELRTAGYIVDAPSEPAPSSMLLNQRSVSTLLTEFLNYLCGWRPFATVVSEHWRTARIERADRSNFPEHPAPNCPLCSFRIGAGSTLPLPQSRHRLDVSGLLQTINATYGQDRTSEML